MWYQVKTLWVNGRVQIISLEEGDRAEAQEVDLHRAEYGTKWMLSQRGERVYRASGCRVALLAYTT